jgi:hypothetical protein
VSSPWPPGAPPVSVIEAPRLQYLVADTLSEPVAPGQTWGDVRPR